MPHRLDLLSTADIGGMSRPAHRNVSDELAAMAGRILGASAELEVCVARLIAACVGADPTMMSALLRDMRSDFAVRTVLKAVVEKRFPETSDVHELAQRVLAQCRAARKLRQPFAHHPWAKVGYAKKELFILQDPRRLVPDFLEAENNDEGSPRGRLEASKFYTREELAQILDKVDATSLVVMLLHSLAVENHHTRQQVVDLLAKKLDEMG